MKKKLLFCVLAMIAFAGTNFAASDAWGFTPDPTEECFLSNYSAVTTGVVDLRIDPTWNKDKTVLHDNVIINTISTNGQFPVAITNEELEVSSWPSISCLNCNTVNPNHDLIDNALEQKRVDTRLC